MFLARWRELTSADRHALYPLCYLSLEFPWHCNPYFRSAGSSPYIFLLSCVLVSHRSYVFEGTVPEGDTKGKGAFPPSHYWTHKPRQLILLFLRVSKHHSGECRIDPLYRTGACGVPRAYFSQRATDHKGFWCCC